eukprot:SAG31_NODE_925_length_10954_cov_3.051589_3_plen_187_part_00
MSLSRFCATIREIRDFNREKYGTNRESVTLQACSSACCCWRLNSLEARKLQSEPNSPALLIELWKSTTVEKRRRFAWLSPHVVVQLLPNKFWVFHDLQRTGSVLVFVSRSAGPLATATVFDFTHPTGCGYCSIGFFSMGAGQAGVVTGVLSFGDALFHVWCRFKYAAHECIFVQSQSASRMNRRTL